MPHGMWDLDQIKPEPPALEVQSLNHWSAREVPSREEGFEDEEDWVQILFLPLVESETLGKIHQTL